ncbi:Glycosyltransferase, GT2 family [Tessaracoccus bendigoensis DSM 12906]|uniref:Glycosyltransferase, GT2 family n=1 Tax=Tessaracoccus bendigoensis DSM 12906 TaxID=1123357 RepID=A0A1M6GZ38_9ACTN|nr:glycosyltransferase family 2 protein [Tessaracoccus bendigoensis]SHJ15192.1 Glycosyltransferase, GT2 family [Tessaracoccus bendigoensis DSM 12906]
MTDEPQHGHEADALWAWIEKEADLPGVDEIRAGSVTAVMVVHNAEEWLPRQLLSLARLDPRPGRLVAVDTGSTDDSAALLERADREGVVDSVITLGADAGFAQAVETALEGSEPEWIWLLHDDSAPHRDALAHLLEGARRSDVVVPKLLEPKRRNYPETISEIGQAITAGGIRVPLAEVGDIDQHQSESREVLGASTAGLLVRGAVWRELGGIAPEVGRHRDGVDLGWRANAVGYRVLTWPQAALNHLRAGHTGLRPDDEHHHVSDRLGALRVAGSRGASTVGLGAASLARAVGFLFAKSPSHAAAELKAWRGYRRSPALTAALAARLPVDDQTPEDLLPSRFWPLRNAVDSFGAGLSERYRSLTEAPAETSIDELTSDDFAAPSLRTRFLSPSTLLVLVLLVTAAIAARTLLGGGPVSGGGLLTAPTSLGEAWQGYLEGDAPWLGLAAVSSLAGFGSPGWFTFLAVVLTPLLAGLSALALLRRLGFASPIACAASAAWAGGTVLLGLVTAGDVTGMVLAVAGPLLVRAVHAVVVNETTGAERLRAPAGAAFWLIVVSAVWPFALPAATIVGVVWALRERARRMEVAVLLAPAWLFLAPWLPTLARYPGRMLTGVDPLAWTDYPPASYALVVGRILPSGLPVWANVVFFAALGLAAVVAMAKLPRKAWLVSLAWLGAPLVIGTALSRLTVSVDGGVVRPLLSPWALLVLAALLLPVLWSQREPGRHKLAGPVALALSGALAVGVWMVVGFAGPVRSVTSVLPGYVRDVISSTRDSRVLALEISDDASVAWNVIDSRQPQWGTGERNPIGSFSAQFNALAYSIAAGDPPDDLAERFRIMGVSHLYVGGVDSSLRATLDNLESMISNPADDRSVVWTVSGLVSRVSIDAEEPFIVDAKVPPGAPERMLYLAESGAADWTASVDSETLPRAGDTERALIDDSVVTFGPLPADGGTLEIHPERHIWRALLHLVVMLGLLLMAAPTLGGATQARRGQ